MNRRVIVLIVIAIMLLLVLVMRVDSIINNTCTELTQGVIMAQPAVYCPAANTVDSRAELISITAELQELRHQPQLPDADALAGRQDLFNRLERIQPTTPDEQLAQQLLCDCLNEGKEGFLWADKSRRDKISAENTQRIQEVYRCLGIKYLRNP